MRRVLIRAHGEPPSTYELSIKIIYQRLIRASSPSRFKILQYRIKKSFDKDETIYIYGKHVNAEWIGLLGQTSKKL